MRLAVVGGGRFRVLPARGAVLDSPRGDVDVTRVGARLAGGEPRL